jgi:uncharacterized membrane protein
MHVSGLLHVGLAVVALAAGLLQLVLTKGTPAHRRLGWLYAASMLGLNGVGFTIYREFGGFGLFHYLAVASLVTIVGGMVPVLLRRPERGWLDLHAYWMSMSYVGLVAAGLFQLATHPPVGRVRTWVVATALAVTFGGFYMMAAQVPRMLADFRKKRDR